MTTPPPGHRRPDQDLDPLEAGCAARARVSAEEVEYMLLVAVRRPKLLDSMKARLSGELFEPRRGETPARLFWAAVAAVADNPGLPADPTAAANLVRAAVAREAATDQYGALYPEADRRAVLGPGGMIDRAFLPADPDATVEHYATGVLGRFLTERVFSDVLRRGISKLRDGDTVADPAALIREAERVAAKISGVGSDPGSDPITGVDFRPPPPQVFPTGIDWLDAVMGGGHAPGETYLVMASTGSGKTSLMVQLFTEGARLQAVAAQSTGRRRCWVYFTYEASETQVQERLYSYGARVDVATYRSPAGSPYLKYSTSASLKPYETEPYVNPPGSPVRFGEAERVAAFVRELTGGWLRVVDYSGTHPGHGTGGVPEMIRYCRGMQANGVEVAGVIIDYAGLAVSRMRQANSRMRPEDDYTLLNSFVDEVRFKLCIPFACPGWVLHQLHGDASTMAVGTRLHISHGRGGRNLGDNCDFAFIPGRVDEKTGLRAVWVDKARRVQKPDGPVIVRFDGRFGVHSRPDGDYVIDAATRSIVEKQLADGFLFGEAPPPPPDIPPAGL